MPFRMYALPRDQTKGGTVSVASVHLRLAPGRQPGVADQSKRRSRDQVAPRGNRWHLLDRAHGGRLEAPKR